MVRIQLCGRFAVVVDGQPTESRLPGRQGRLLVAYLATYRAQPVERTVLLDALWPDGGAGAAGALTVLLSKARTLLAPAEIHGRRTLQLILPADSAVDLETATTSCTRRSPPWRCGTGAAPGRPRSPPTSSYGNCCARSWGSRHARPPRSCMPACCVASRSTNPPGQPPTPGDHPPSSLRALPAHRRHVRRGGSFHPHPGGCGIRPSCVSSETWS